MPWHKYKAYWIYIDSKSNGTAVCLKILSPTDRILKGSWIKFLNIKGIILFVLGGDQIRSAWSNPKKALSVLWQIWSSPARIDHFIIFKELFLITNTSIIFTNCSNGNDIIDIFTSFSFHTIMHYAYAQKLRQSRH